MTKLTQVVEANRRHNESIGSLFDTIEHGRERDQYDALCDTCDNTLTEDVCIYIWDRYGINDDRYDQAATHRCICEDCHVEDEDSYRAEGWKEVSDDE